MGLQILLIDDDPVFCRILEKMARRYGMSLTVQGAEKPDQIMPDARFFDVAIVDQQLGDALGVEVARSLGEIPVVLISSNRTWLATSDGWPENIRFFVDKRYGALTILRAVFDAVSPRVRYAYAN